MADLSIRSMRPVPLSTSLSLHRPPWRDVFVILYGKYSVSLKSSVVTYLSKPIMFLAMITHLSRLLNERHDGLASTRGQNGCDVVSFTWSAPSSNNRVRCLSAAGKTHRPCRTRRPALGSSAVGWSSDSDRPAPSRWRVRRRTCRKSHRRDGRTA